MIRLLICLFIFGFSFNSFAAPAALQVESSISGYLDNAGKILANGKIEFFTSDAYSTYKPVYSDAAKTTVLAQPISLNSSGVPVNGAGTPVAIFADGVYWMRLKSSAGLVIRSYRSITYQGAIDFGGLYIDVASSYGRTDTALTNALADYSGSSSQVTFLFNSGEFVNASARILPSNVKFLFTNGAYLTNSGSLTAPNIWEFQGNSYINNSSSVSFTSGANMLDTLGSTLQGSGSYSGAFRAPMFASNEVYVPGQYSTLNLAFAAINNSTGVSWNIVVVGSASLTTTASVPVNVRQITFRPEGYFTGTGQLTFTGQYIQADIKRTLASGIRFSGIVSNDKVYLTWFGAIPDISTTSAMNANYDAFKDALSISARRNAIVINQDFYTAWSMSRQGLYIPSYTNIEGVSDATIYFKEIGTVLETSRDSRGLFKFSDVTDITIKNLSFSNEYISDYATYVSGTVVPMITRGCILFVDTDKYVDNLVVENCDFYSKCISIDLFNTHKTRITGNRFHFSRLSSTGSPSLALGGYFGTGTIHDSKDVIIESNIFYDQKTPTLNELCPLNINYCDNLIVRDNIIGSSTYDTSILLEGGTDIDFSGNIIDTSTGSNTDCFGLTFANVTRVNISNNIFNGNSNSIFSPGVYSYRTSTANEISDDITIRDNEFYHFQTGIRVGTDDTTGNKYRYGRHVIEDNYFSGSTTAAYFLLNDSDSYLEDDKEVIFRNNYSDGTASNNVFVLLKNNATHRMGQCSFTDNSGFEFFLQEIPTNNILLVGNNSNFNDGKYRLTSYLESLSTASISQIKWTGEESDYFKNVSDKSGNLLLYSNDISQTEWVKASATVTQNGTLDPFGNNAFCVVASVNTAEHSIRYESIPVSANSYYTFKFLIKKGDVNNFYVVLKAKTSSTETYLGVCYVQFNNLRYRYQRGNSNFTFFDVKPIEKGWYEVSCGMYMDNTIDNMEVKVAGASTFESATYLGVGAVPDYYVSRLCLTQRNDSGSYIDTVGAAVHSNGHTVNGMLMLKEQSVAPPAVKGGIYFNGTSFYISKDGVNWVTTW